MQLDWAVQRPVCPGLTARCPRVRELDAQAPRGQRNCAQCARPSLLSSPRTVDFQARQTPRNVVSAMSRALMLPETVTTRAVPVCDAVSGRGCLVVVKRKGL